MKSHEMVCVVAGVVGLAATSVVAQPSFQGLGDLPGGGFSSDAWRLSDEGLAGVGSGEGAGGDRAMRWTVMDGMVPLGTLPGFGSGLATGISASGRHVVGYLTQGAVSEAFLWSAVEGMVSLGDLPGGVHSSRAYNISTDGSTVVGRGDQVDNWPIVTGEAFRWTPGTGMVGLGFSKPHHEDSEAWCLSADGSIIAGLSYTNGLDGEAFIWTQGAGMVGLGDVPGGPDEFSVAADMTPDGSVIVGECSPAGGYEGFRWTQATGMVPLGDLPGGDHYSSAFAVTADGNIIVGMGNWDGGFGAARATIWDPMHGLRELQPVLESEYGLDLTGWTLLYANDISADGRYIIGQGFNPNGDLEAWLVDLGSTPCAGDFNGDGVLNFFDVQAFLNAFSSGCD